MRLVTFSLAAYGLCTLCMVSVHRLTIYHAYSCYVTVCHAASRCLRCMYAISLCLYTILLCPPPKCVNLRTAYEKDVDRSIFHSSLLTLPKFHLLRCSSVAPSLSSNAVEGLAAALGRAFTNYYCETWSHGETEGKAIKRSRYKDKIPDLLFAEGLEKRRKSKKKKSQRSRYKDEIPVFISRLTGI